jgi:hypothetical protein
LILTAWHLMFPRYLDNEGGSKTLNVNDPPSTHRPRPLPAWRYRKWNGALRRYGLKRIAGRLRAYRRGQWFPGH